jgi:alkaline phosphatase D
MKPSISLLVAAALAMALLVSPSAALAQKKTAAARKRPNQYKRIHQQALKQITDGNAAKAVTALEGVIRKHPDDAESYFMLTVALAQVGKVDEAVAAMQQAIKLGLPPARFIAGPRDLLTPIHGSAAYKALAERSLSKPVHGPLVGSVTESGVTVWLRTAKEVDVVLAVHGAGKSHYAKAHSAAAGDYTAAVKISGLRPDTEYTYGLTISPSEDFLHNPAWRFRTSPKPGSKTKFTLAFGGGAGYVPEHERMWNTIGKFNPRLMLLLGDNTYSDAPKSPHMQKYCYYRRQSRPEFSALVSRTPTYTIWDDHDFGTNDCWGGPAIEMPTWKRPVWNVFKQNWANPGYGGGSKQPGVWYDFSLGDVDFIMLDGRYYRTDPKVEKPSMLGPVQLAWLTERLKASRGTFKVICSPVPWEYRTKGKSRDTWNGFQAEREKIFSLIEKEKIEGVLLMSADRHRSDAWQIKRPGGYDLYEFNSSRLTNQHVHGEMAAAIFSYNKKQSFGLVTFDTTAADPTVTYKVINIDGKEMHTITLKRSQLGF